MPEQDSGFAIPRPLIVLSIVLATLLLVGVGAIGLLSPHPQPSRPANPGTPGTGPLAVPAVPAPAAGTPECAGVLAAVPHEMPSGTDTLTRRDLTPPVPPATVAWAGRHSQPVVLRCGLDRPAELTPTSELRDVSGVQWLPISGDGGTTWLVVDRPVYVALTLPSDAGTGPLQDISETMRTTLPARAPDIGGVLPPARPGG